jgi:hypothetical protein
MPKNSKNKRSFDSSERFLTNVKNIRLVRNPFGLDSTYYVLYIGIDLLFLTDLFLTNSLKGID